MAQQDPNKIVFPNNLDDILASAKKLKEELDNLSRAEDILKRKMNETNQKGKGRINLNDDISEQGKKARKDATETYEDGKKKVKDWLNTFRESRKEMTRSMAGLNPIDTSEFSSGFQLSAKSLFGFGSAIKSAFSEMKSLQGMRHEMAYLADASGNAGKAVGAVFNIAAGSAISRTTAQGVVRTLADQGLALTDAAGNASPKIERLGKLAGDLQAATGIAASQWGSFTGELSFNYGLSEKGIQNIASALVGTGLRAQHLERAMSTVNKVMQTTAYIAGVPTDASMNNLTKSIGGAMKAFQKLGISAEKAGSFIEGIVDPENFEKNSVLFAHLGISAGEYAESLNDVNGQQKLLEKVMGNLPDLAQKLSSIQNPFARMEMAKTLGLDMQTVRRMASASKEDIEKIMKEYEEKNKADEALAKKKEQMTADAAKWDDMIWSLKMQVLQPVMKMLSGGYLQKFIGMLPKIAGAISEIFKTVSPIIEGIVDMMVGMIPAFQDFIKTITNFFSGFTSGVKETLGVATDTFSGGKGGGKPSESAQFWGTALKYLAGMYAGIKVISIGLGLGKGLYSGFKTIQSGISILFGNGKKKNIANATLGDLEKTIGNGIRQSHIPTKPSKMGMGGGGLLGTVLTAGMLGSMGSEFMKSAYDTAFGESSYEDLQDKDKVYTGQSDGGTIIKNTGRQMAGDFGWGVGSGTLLQSGIAAKRFKDSLDFGFGGPVRVASQGAQTRLASMSIVKMLEPFGKVGAGLSKASGTLLKVSTKLGPAGLALGVGIDAFQAATGKTRAERWGAYGSLASTAIGAGLGSMGGGIGAIPGAMLGQTIGSFIVKPIASAIGGYYDKQETLDEIKNDASFKMVEQFGDVAKSIKDKGSYKTTYEEKIGENFDYSKSWKENEKMLEKQNDEYFKSTLKREEQLTKLYIGKDPAILAREKIKALQKIKNEKELTQKQFEVLRLKEAYNKGDQKTVNEQLKIIKEKKWLSNEEFKELIKNSKEKPQEKKVDYAKKYDTAKLGVSAFEAYKDNNFDALELIIKTIFKKIKSAIWEGIKLLTGTALIFKVTDALGWTGGNDYAQMGQNANKIAQLQNDIKKIDKNYKFTNYETKTEEQQDAYILELTMALGKVKKAVDQNTKATKDGTAATKENTEAVKDATSSDTKEINLYDILTQGLNLTSN